MTYHWTIGTDRSDGGIVSNGELTEGTPSYTRGGSIQLQFGFWDSPDITADHVARYEALREYGDFAGASSVQRSIDGVPHYTEQLPVSASVDSLVLDFVPGASVDSTPGIWGVVTGMTDPTRFPADSARLTLDVVVLAELPEYATRSDVEAALKETVV